jgi:hypothetical protein
MNNAYVVSIVSRGQSRNDIVVIPRRSSGPVGAAASEPPVKIVVHVIGPSAESAPTGYRNVIFGDEIDIVDGHEASQTTINRRPVLDSGLKRQLMRSAVTAIPNTSVNLKLVNNERQFTQI